MALTRYTKIKLTNDRVEQSTGTTLNLSGETIFDSGSTLSILTNAASGKVLTSNTGGTATWQYPDASLKLIINQTSHGFDLLDVVGYSGTTYNKPIADGNYEGEVIGIATRIIDANNFEVTQSGYIDTFTGLTQATTYFLSDTTAGELITGQTEVVGHVIKPVLFADSTTSGWVIPFIGTIVTSGTTFTGLTDTPTGYTSENYVRVNTSADALEYRTPSQVLSDISGISTTCFNTYTGTSAPILNGAITGATNIGSGENIYSTTTDRVLQLRSIVGSGDTTVSTSGDTIIVYDPLSLHLDQTTTQQTVTGGPIMDFIDFNTLYADGINEGRLQWNSEDGTLELGMPGSNVALQIGQEELIRVRNDSGALIENGKAVKITGGTSGFVRIGLADNTSIGTMDAIGVATENIADGAFGYVTTRGFVRDINTSGFTVGDLIWLGTNGDLTKIRPTPPAFSTVIGRVIKADAIEGVIYVTIQVALRLIGLSDVKVSGLTDGQILSYSGGTWNNITPSATTYGTLNTTCTTALSANASESFGSAICLHKISKTGTYGDLIGTPTIGNGILTVSGGTLLTGSGTFCANQTGDTTINVCHSAITTNSGTTAQTASFGGTFTAIDSVTTNSGHLTCYRVKTVTLPTPTAPSDATICISAGTGLITGGDFTLNQAGNETISLAHAAYTARNVSATGANIISCVVSDGLGHVTNVLCRTLSPSDIGALSASTFNTYTGDTSIILNAAITGGTNGIGHTGRNVCLGGALSNATSILGGGNALCLGTSASKLSTLSVNTTSNVSITSGGLLISSSGATFTDLSASPQGIKYATDYSSTYDTRSLVDKGYVDTVATGLQPHEAVKAATTGSSITLSGLQTIDGVSLIAGDRVLVKNQSTASQNGIYVVDAGAWTRATDFNDDPTGFEVKSGDIVPVISGNTNASSIWILTTPDPITVGTTSLEFTLFSKVLGVTAGAGITITPSGTNQEISINLATNSGLNTTSGLSIDESIAGSGLTWSTGVLRINASHGGVTGIPVRFDSSCNLVVNSTDINTSLGSPITGATNIGAGSQIYSGTTNKSLQLRTLVGSGDTTVSTVGNEIRIYTNIPATTYGTLNTTCTTALSTNASESFANAICLHKIAKTGCYAHLSGTPTIGDGILTVTGGTLLTGTGTFCANQTGNTTITLNHETLTTTTGTTAQTATYGGTITMIDAVTGNSGHITGVRNKTVTLPAIYSHPTGFGNQPSTALINACVISQILVSPEGHVTGTTSRNLTAANIGAVSTGITITINGTAQNLSTNRTWNVGTVTSVATGDGLTGGTITDSGTICVDATVVRTTGNQSIGGIKSFTDTCGINILNSRILNGQNLDVDSGATRTIITTPVGTHTSAFFDYTISKSTNARAGTVIAVWNGSNIEFAEYSTVDIGSTSDVQLLVRLSGGNVLLVANTLSNDWVIKSVVRMI